MTTTIQQTAKRFKLLILLGVLGMLFGLLTIFVSGGEGFGAVVLGSGLVLWLVGKIGKWWHHE